MTAEMRCPNCQFDNPPGTRFCGRCGTNLERVCPSCGTFNPEGFVFCGTCGTRLTPEPAPARPSEERKVVTILFADLAGSTALGERLDPEQVRIVVGQFFESMADLITRYGGTVEKFVGDEVMAVFGLPSAHEDDPARAVHAAQAMHARLQEVNPQLQMRIGINTGEVVANPQAADKGEFMVTGDAVNVGARLRSAAAPGTTVVGERTYRETAWLADYSACPPFTLKGKSAPVAAWQLTGLRPEPTRRPTAGLRAPLIGRQDEFMLLQGLLQRVLRERRPHLVTVLGMPGVGKSRLVEEMLVSSAALTVRQGRSLAYGSTSLWAIAEIIRVDCGILRSDSVSLMADKLQRRIGELLEEEPAREQIAGQLARILAIQVRDGVTPTEESREDLFWSIHRYVEAIARHTPLILVFDDIHWADAELLDLIEYLAQGTADVPLMIVGMARPELLEIRPAWGGGKRNYTSLFLEPLTATDTDRLLKELLHGDEPPPAVISTVGVAEGNPFFVEEILRMMIDAGALQRQDGEWTVARGVRVSVPDTVQGVVTARIDRLRREEKSTLLEASVLGKDFWSSALGFLTGQPAATLASVLQTLLVKDFLIERERSRLEGQREFTFKHLIIRDTAYQMLPKARRAAQHRAFGAWLEQTLTAEGFAELLAHHWLQAARLTREIGQIDAWSAVAPKALEYTLAAARKAARVYANDQAVTHFQTARALAEELGVEAEQVVAIEGLADVCALQAQWEEASRLYQEALTYHLQKGDAVRQARVQSRIGSTFSGIHDFRQALPHIESALEKLQSQQDEQELASVYLQMARAQAALGNYSDAEELARKGISLADQRGSLLQLADGQWALGLISTMLGRSDADSFFAKSIEIAEQLNDLGRAIPGYANRGYRHRIRGEYLQAREAYGRALTLARQINNRSRMGWPLYSLSHIHFMMGEWAIAREYATQYLAMSQEVPTWVEFTKSILAVVQGDLVEALNWGKKAIDHAENRREVAAIGLAVDWCAFLLLRLNRPQEALHMLSGAAQRFTSMQVFWPAYLHPLAAEAALALDDSDLATEEIRRAEAFVTLDIKPAQARLMKAQGMLQTARASLHEGAVLIRQAVELYRQIGQPYDLALTLEELADVHRRRASEADRSAEREALDEAMKIYQQLGAEFEVRRLQDSPTFK